MGTGIGKSRQKYLFLPEPQNDFIFAIVCEELGFVGALVIILLSVALERLLLWVTDRVQKRRKGGERDAAV